MGGKQVIELDYDQEYESVHDTFEDQEVKLFFKIRGSKVVYVFNLKNSQFDRDLSVNVTPIGVADFCYWKASRRAHDE